MKNKLRKISMSLEPFETGQIWRMGDSSVVIGLVGKNLVHYKHSNDKAKRPPILLTRKVVLEKFLQEQRAILTPGAARPVAPPAKSAGLPRIRRAGLKASVGMTKPKPTRAD